LDCVGSFLDVAKQHGRDTAPLWALLESQPDKLAASAWATSLDCVGSFLDVAKQHGRDTAPLWALLESQPDKLAASAWATTLGDLGSFLDVARQHGRDTAPLWALLESQPDKLAASAWATTLGDLGSFLDVARQHGRDTAPLWKILASEPDRLSQKGRSATKDALVGFAHYAPISVFEIALREIRPGHWNSTPDSKGLTGATWLASKCADAKRGDLSADLKALLLRRANWRDFPPQSGGYGQLCWFIANLPSAATELVEPLLKAVRANRWLQIAYAATSCGQLASGLRQLALHQSVQRCRQFHHKGLGGRLIKELARFETAAPNEQSAFMQFLGCAGLCGWAVSQRSLASITFATVSELPLGILPHRPEATKIEDYQLQLWLGLRAFVSITRERLPLPRETIEQTLKLWRANLGETALTPATAAHRVNQSMVAWLETCSRATPPALVPSPEPLWTLAGFPVQLDRPNWLPRNDSPPRS
ncbi:MAG TPA: hypothetical protein PLX89_08570, partial [Verrucomicrobiota bacterium]|nr:hypothetical protein [Verrucomicrobiota bacterium]